MNWPLWLAFRFIRTRSGRLLSLTSWAAVIGIFLGVTALVIAMALMTGFQQDLKSRILGGTPHVIIQGIGPEALVPVLRHLDDLREISHVRAVYPVIYGQVLLAGPQGSQGVFIKGLSPSARARIPILQNVIAGSWTALTARQGIAIGYGLAQQLGVWVGDRVTLVAPEGLFSPMGVLPRIRRLRVAAVFQSDMYEFDHHWAFIDFDLARHLFQISEGASAVEILTDDVDTAPTIARAIRRRLEHYRIFVQTWMDQNQALFSALQLEKWMLFVAITLIVVVASFNIITHLTLTVWEKRSRIAMLMAMGAEPRTIRRVFLLQGLVLGVLGITTGLLVGITASWFLDHYQVIRLPMEVYFIPYLPFRVRWLDAAAIGLSAVGIVLVSAWFPAQQVTRLHVGEILRAPP